VVSGSYDGTIKLATGHWELPVLFLGIHKEFGLSPSAPMGTLLVAVKTRQLRFGVWTLGNSSHYFWAFRLGESRCDQLRWADPCQAVGIKQSKFGIYNGELPAPLWAYKLKVISVALSPDRQTLVSSSQDKTIKIWSLGTGELLHSLLSTQTGF